MAKISLILDKRRAHKDGTFPVCLKFTNVNTAALYLTPYRLQASQWRNGRVINHERAVEMNHRLHQLVLQATEAMESSCGFVNRLQAVTIRDKVVRVLEGGDTALVMPTFEKFVSMKSKPSTIDSFQYTAATLQKYCNLDSLAFDDITVEWLTKWEQWLLERVKRNTCAIHLENLRAVVNFAVAEELTQTYSFRRFRIKRETSQHRCLSLQDMRKLWSMNPQDPYQAWYLDTFRLSFALCGMNIADIYALRPSNIVNGRIEVNRQKTGVFLSIPITKEAQEIIARMRGREHLVNIADRYKNHKDFLSRCNRGLDKLWPELTTYYARHTWATLMAELGAPIEVIGLGLGHQYGSPVTNIYVRHDLKRLDKAHAKVMEAVTKKDPPA